MFNYGHNLRMALDSKHRKNLSNTGSVVRGIGIEIAFPTVLLCLMLQLHLPIHFTHLARLDLPLLVVIYLAPLQKNPISGLLVGTAIGLAQDSLTQGTIGSFGILKTVTAYLALSTSHFIKIDLAPVRALLIASLFLIHQILFGILESMLLNREISTRLLDTFIIMLVHAGVGVLLFQFLDRFRRES